MAGTNGDSKGSERSKVTVARSNVRMWKTDKTYKHSGYNNQSCLIKRKYKCTCTYEDKKINFSKFCNHNFL